MKIQNQIILFLWKKSQHGQLHVLDAFLAVTIVSYFIHSSFSMSIVSEHEGCNYEKDEVLRNFEQRRCFIYQHFRLVLQPPSALDGVVTTTSTTKTWIKTIWKGIEESLMQD